MSEKTRYTFVVEFDGKGPEISAATDILGGQLCSVQFSDAIKELERYRDALRTIEGYGMEWSEDCRDFASAILQGFSIEEALAPVTWDDYDPNQPAPQREEG